MNRFDREHLVGARLIGLDGRRIGKISQVLPDDQLGASEWVSVRTGLFAGRRKLVPLSGARLASNRRLLVPYSKDQVREAPSVDVGTGRIGKAQEASLYRYYGSEVGTSETGEQAGIERGPSADANREVAGGG